MTAFESSPQWVGQPRFGLIHIDAQEVAKAFQAYLNTASRLTGVSLDDIDRRVSAIPADTARVTLIGLLEAGMKLFDAVVWLSAGRPASHPLMADPTITADKIPSMHEVARSVFYCYFMLVTQARYPVHRSETEKPRIPNFLRSIMGMQEEQHVYVERICSFAPQKFDPAWARYVRFDGFGQEVMSRFGLGVAGYRYFAPFALYPPRAGLSQAQMDAYNFAANIARSPASWDIHPLTRNPNVQTSRGNLNKNLGNLMLEVFTDADLDEMVTSRLIFAKPTKEPSYRNYTTWSPEDNISGTAQIFSS